MMEENTCPPKKDLADFQACTTCKESMAIATPISLGLSWPHFTCPSWTTTGTLHEPKAQSQLQPQVLCQPAEREEIKKIHP